MRTLLLSLVGTLCLVVSAQAQLEISLDHDASRDPDILTGKIRVGMTPAEVRELAAAEGWTLAGDSSESQIYQYDVLQAHLIQNVFFTNGRARAASCTITASLQHEKVLTVTFEAARRLAVRRSDMVSTDGSRTLLEHTTSDGRMMREIWTRVSATQATIEVEVEAAAEVADDAAGQVK